MEVAINQLECHFQQALNDVDFIERKLRAEFTRHTPADIGDEANVVRLLERISNVKSSVETLVRDTAMIADEKQTMASFMQHFISQTSVPLSGVCNYAGMEITEADTAALQGVRNLIDASHTSVSSASSSHGSGAADATTFDKKTKQMPTPQQESRVEGASGNEVAKANDVAKANVDANEVGFMELSMNEFKKVPARLRKGVTLEEVNDACFILYEHFVVKRNKKALSKAQIQRTGIENAANVFPCLEALDLCRVTPSGSVAVAK